MVEQGSTANPVKLIYKFPLTNPLFTEYEIILNWKFSNTILITAFDLLKDERLIVELQRRGISLKEYLQGLGFNKDVKILCDTGIFEFEVKKAKLQMDIPVESSSFTTEDIFRAYELIKPDFLVAPDEIIMQSDSEETIKNKIDILEKNLDLTIDQFPKEKIFAVLHGFSNAHLERITQFIRDRGITRVARGGLIPLWAESKDKFKEVVKRSEQKARQNGINYLHSFGLPSLRVIKDYFYTNTYDTLDTSVLYFRTAQRKFLINKGYFISVRYAHFKRCGCEGCSIMEKIIYKPNSGAFAVGLYYHNCMMLNSLVSRLQQEPNIFDDPKRLGKRRKRTIFYDKGINEISENLKKGFVSADKLIPSGELVAKPVYIQKSATQTTKISLKILIISSCSKTKTLTAPVILSLNDLKTKSQRKRILDSEVRKIEAQKLYGSKRIKIVNEVLSDLRSVCTKAELFFLSAGFGLIQENTKLPAYDVSFINKTDSEIKKMSEDLEIAKNVAKLDNYYDVIFLDLTGPYLQALEPLSDLLDKTKELIVFGPETSFQSEKIILLNEIELMGLDKKTNYFPFRLHEHVRASLLKNFFLFLINQDVLGTYTSFKDWIEKILKTGYQNRYQIRAI